MRNFSLYMMFTGILIIAISGNWIILNYDNVTVYPKTSYVIFTIGLVFVAGAFVMSRFTTYRETASTNDKRDALNRWLMANYPVNKWLIGLAVLPLVIAPFYSWLLLYTLFKWYLIVGSMIAGIIFVLQGERVEDDADWQYKGKTKKMLDLIDYRKHPFNISLILFILVIGSFIFSKQWNIPLHMDVGGNPYYVVTLPISASVMSALMVMSTFIYIIHHGDFFGFLKAGLSYERVMAAHFGEIFMCSPTLCLLIFTWIISLSSYW
ncbi:nucleotidyltransferase [Solibacillus sp. FSL W7-1464]|uniref:nucleotidyltransferase n=1 Tax=Solibacillus sp. FSL W7-1464 TaxID=2921706 RepID=UPI0030F60449